MNIKYILSFPISLIYHIFAQINFQKEWGDASLFSQQYIEFLNKENKKLIITDSKKREIKKILKEYFVLLTFVCLRPWYIDYDKLTEDFKKDDFIIKKITCYPDLSFNETKKAFGCLIDLMEEINNDYSLFWKNNKKTLNERIKTFEKIHKKIFSDYYQYSHKEINQNIPTKEKYFIFMIPSLFEHGRGLEGGCAIGIPSNKNETKQIISLSLHELTHSFTDPLLIAKIGPKQGISPNTMTNHEIKEQLAEYILQEYLKQNYPDLASKETFRYPLLTKKIKKSLGIV